MSAVHSLCLCCCTLCVCVAALSVFVLLHSLCLCCCTLCVCVAALSVFVLLRSLCLCCCTLCVCVAALQLVGISPDLPLYVAAHWPDVDPQRNASVMAHLAASGYKVIAILSISWALGRHLSRGCWVSWV